MPLDNSSLKAYMDQWHAGRHLASPVIGLAILAAIVYWPSLSGEFLHLDDYQYVVDNELVRRPSWAAVRQFFSEVTRPSTVDGYYQPLTMVSLMLDVWLSRGGEYPGTFVFHLTNVLLHAATTVLVMILLRRVVGGLAIPLLLAVLFAVHPAQVESVAWISQRKTLLASLFAVGCLLCYLRYGRNRQTCAPAGSVDSEGPALRPPVGSERNRLWLLAAWGLYLGAGLAKPTVMFLPLVLPLLDFWPLERPARKSLREKIPFFIAMLVMAWVAWVSQANAATLQRPSLAAHDAVVKWIGLLCYNLMLYAGNVVWPLHLSPYRAMPAELTPANPAVGLSIVLMIGLCAVWLTSLRWSRPLFVGITAFAILLSPALGPVRFMASCVADRFIYLPLVFLLFPLAALAKRLEAVLPNGRRLVLAGLILLAVPLLILTRAQQGIWRNSKTLWDHVAAAVPDLPQAHGNLALTNLEEENFDGALEHISKALRQDPENAEFLHLLGRIYVRTGRAAEAVETLQKALRNGLSKAQPTGRLSLAEAYLVAGDREAARQSCDKALALGRTPGDTYACLGDTAMRFARRYDWAVDYYNLAVQEDPDSALYHWNMGTALHAAGRSAEALQEYERAIAVSARRGQRLPELEAAAEKLRGQLGPTATQPSRR